MTNVQKDHQTTHKYVFIGGLHRSGTTLLARCLRDHPRVSGFQHTGRPADEGQHLQSIYTTDTAHGGPGRFCFDPTAYMNESACLATPATAAMLQQQWSQHWDVDKEFLLEKSPPNLIRTRFLQVLFPASYFVIIMRHPIPVTFATRKIWSGIPIHSLIDHWLIGYEQFERDKVHIHNVHILRYETLVDNPPATLAKIYSFLGLEFAPPRQEIRPGINQTYFSMWNELINGKQVNKFYVNYRYILQKFEARISRFGYSLETLEASK